MVRCSSSHDNALVSAITLKEGGSVFECPAWVFLYGVCMNGW